MKKRSRKLLKKILESRWRGQLQFLSLFCLKPLPPGGGEVLIAALLIPYHANNNKGKSPGREGGASGGAPCTAPSTGGKGLQRPFCWLPGQGQAFKLTLTSQESSANPAKAKYLEEYLSFSGVLVNLLSQSISE